MKKIARTVVAIVAAGLSLAAAGPAGAVPVLTFDEATGRDVGNGPFSIGWTFDVTAPVTVTGLGWYDQGKNGLEAAHQVGLWGPDHSLLNSVTVPSGMTAPLSGQFREVAIPSIVLSPGKGYTIGGQTAAGLAERVVGGDSPFSRVAQSVDARLASLKPVTTVGDPTFARPSFPLGDYGFFGPSFSVVPAPTPTPPQPLSIVAAPASVRAGDAFTLGLNLTQNITRPFDFYQVMAAPFGVFTVEFTGALTPGIRPLFTNIPSFAAPFSHTTWNGIIVPPGIAGTFTFYAAVIEAGQVPPVTSLDQLSATTPTIIMFDKKVVTVLP